MSECKTCGGDTHGYKCSACGLESDMMMSEHECGDGTCGPKCDGCGENEKNCTCS